MSLESKIDALTAAVVALTAQLQAQQAPTQAATAVVPQQAAATTPVPQAPAPDPASFAPPVPAPAPQMPPVPAPAPQMPPTPSFMAPPVAAAPTVPFTDTKGLITYMTQAYTSMPPEKGAQMQNVLTNFGYGNANDVRPEHFPAVFQAIEALKA